MAHCIKTDKVKKYNTTIKSYCKDLEVNTPKVCGNYTIKSIRKYKYWYEVDIEFKGKIYCRYSNRNDWYSTSFLTKHRKASLIKVNRLVRRYIIDDIKNYLSTFNIKLEGIDTIKKLKHL